MNTWNKRFMDLAGFIASWSKDPSHKIGAVIVNKDKKIISTGFNGFAKGIEDTEERLNDKSIKRALMLHAEENAILHAKQDLSNCDIYISGYLCCIHCASLIIQSGIKTVYYKNTRDGKEVSEYWKDNLKQAADLLSEANVKLIEME